MQSKQRTKEEKEEEKTQQIPNHKTQKKKHLSLNTFHLLFKIYHLSPASHNSFIS